MNISNYPVKKNVSQIDIKMFDFFVALYRTGFSNAY
jgi:hypothetical protein